MQCSYNILVILYALEMLWLEMRNVAIIFIYNYIFYNARIFLGVERLHPLVSLQYELNMMPLRWEGMRRCIEFWVTVLRLNEDRLLKVVMLEALERGSKIKCVQNLKSGDVWMGAISAEDLDVWMILTLWTDFALC